MAGVLFDLPPAPRLKLTIERGGTQAIVRIYFDDDIGRRSCLDSRLLSRAAAIKLATRIAETGVEVSVVAFVYKMVRPPDYRVRRAKRLDEHRLNRVRGLVTYESMFDDDVTRSYTTPECDEVITVSAQQPRETK